MEEESELSAKDGEQPKVMEVPRRKKRGAKKQEIGPKRKQSYTNIASTSKGTIEIEGLISSETSSSYQTSDFPSDSLSDFGSSKEASGCGIPFNEPHLCTDTDFFSATASDIESESDSKMVIPTESTRAKSRKKKSNLAYRRKAPPQSTKCSQENESDIEVDIEEVSESEAASIEETTSEAKSEATLETLTGSIPESTQPPSTSSHPEECPEETHGDEAAPVVDKAVLLLINNLKLLLSDDWSIDVVKSDIIRIIHLNTSKNAGVEACISYDFKNANLGLFVHGAPVPSENKIFRLQRGTDADNIGSVSDFLCDLAGRVLASRVCSGIQEFQELWPKFDGFSDNCSSQDKECFRRSDCMLLLEDKKKLVSICRNCQALKSYMSKEESRKREARGNQVHIPDKYKTKEEIKEQKDFFKKKYRKEKQRAERLERKVDALQVKLDEVLKDDLTSILRNNAHKMTEVQKLFWESQMQALAINDKRGLRWHPMLIRLALHLHSLSPAAYEYMQDSSILVLPSKRRLYDYSHFIEAEEGCQEEIIADIKKKILNCGPEDHFSYVNVLFDEMHIRSGLVTKRSTGQLIGYTNLTDVEKDLSKLQHEFDNKTYKPKLAKKVLVYMVKGISSDIKDVVAVYSTDDLSAVQLHDRTWDVIYHLEDAGIKVLSLTFDGASTNRKFIRMHQCRDKSSRFVYCTNNLAAGDLRPLYFIVDPPHLLKSVRNALANSFSHRKSRKLWKNGEYLSWKVYEKLYEITKNDKFRGHKLTKAHIKLSSFSCMTVSFATQALSKSVADCIESLANHDSMEMFDTKELVKLIRMMNRFFDCVNGKQEVSSELLENPDLAAYSDPKDDRLTFLENSFLEYFEDWKKDILQRPGIYTETERSQSIISHQALEALQITVHSIAGCIRFMLEEAKAPSVNARVFNQDPLEQYFSIVRRKQGDNRNPTMKSFQDSRLQIHSAGQAAAPSRRGNTETEKRKMIKVDSSPLPSRKVRKTSHDH